MPISAENYYSFEPLLAKDCFINMIISIRGTGKTYVYKKKCIDDFLNFGNQFAWIRRRDYETEKIIKENTLFDTFIDEEGYREHIFKIKNEICYIDGKRAGFLITLKGSSRYKSGEYKRVTNIIFDEFIITKLDGGTYIYNECNLFMNLLSTLVRGRDEPRVYMLGNYDEVYVPYFQYFNLYPVESQRFSRNGDKLLEFYKNKKFEEENKNTRLGRIIQETQLSGYLLNNEFVEDNENYVKPFSGNMRFIFGFKLKNAALGIWLDKYNDLYISQKLDLNKKNLIREINDFNNMKFLLKNSEIPAIKMLRIRLSQNLVYYDSIMTKSIFRDNIRMII